MSAHATLLTHDDSCIIHAWNRQNRRTTGLRAEITHELAQDGFPEIAFVYLRGSREPGARLYRTQDGIRVEEGQVATEQHYFGSMEPALAHLSATFIGDDDEEDAIAALPAIFRQ
jgi:hypothetical protein